MSPRSPQSGAAGVLVVVVLVLMMVVILAGYLLTRVDSNRGDRTETMERIAKAAEALDAYVATASRLPCPADPSLDTGDEVLPAPGAATCSFPEGTIPWRTIALRRDGALDGWGRKLSYRVYTGAAGSLTQPGGASMVRCDEGDTGPRTPTVGSLGGLCNPVDPSATPVFYDTSPDGFRNGKELPLTENGSVRTNVAYVVISHGATGFGGYTSSGVRLDLPSPGDERDNTRPTGPFTIRSFSASDVQATHGQHFDDLLAYRTIQDLMKRTGLDARPWEEAGATSAALFTRENVERAAGRELTSTENLNVQSIYVGEVRVQGGASGNPEEIVFDEHGGHGGLGVETGLSSHLESSANESLRFDFATTYRRFAITLNHLGTYGNYVELVLLQYYLDDLLVATGLGAGCQPDGSVLTSFSQDAGVDFNRVVVSPFLSFNTVNGTTGITTLLISEVKACAPSEPCSTALSLLPESTNSCPNAILP